MKIQTDHVNARTIVESQQLNCSCSNVTNYKLHSNQSKSNMLYCRMPYAVLCLCVRNINFGHCGCVRGPSLNYHRNRRQETISQKHLEYESHSNNHWRFGKMLCQSFENKLHTHQALVNKTERYKHLLHLGLYWKLDYINELCHRIEFPNIWSPNSNSIFFQQLNIHMHRFSWMHNALPYPTIEVGHSIVIRTMNYV